MTGTAEGVTSSAAPDTGEPSPEQKAAELPVRPGVIIGMLAVAAFVMIFNETVLTVALQVLTVELEVTATTVQWLTSGFLLTMAVIIPTTGYLLQRLTPRTVFLLAMSLFSVGTLISGLAPGFVVLLAGRVVQAAGTAVMIPLLMTTVMTLIPVERRGSMMGTLSIVIAVAPALGPTYGGFVLTHFGWRWMFLSVLPLALVVLVLGALFMKVSSRTRSIPLDLLSVLLSAIAFGGIVYGFATIGEGGGHGVPPWLPLAAGAVALALFVWRQIALQRDDRALLDLRPFANPQFRLAAILLALVFMSLLGAAAILLPLFLQSVIGVGPDVAGYAVLPGGLLLALLGRPVGMIYDRVGPRPLVVPGAVALATSLWLLALAGPISIWWTIGSHVLLMIGLGLMMTPLLTTALGVLPQHLYSHGSAIATTLQQVAGAAAIAGLVTVATLASASATGTPDATGLQVAFMVSGGVAVLAVVVSLFITGQSFDGSATPAAATRSGEPGGSGGSGAPADPAASEVPVPPVAAGATAAGEVPVESATARRPAPLGAHQGADTSGATDRTPATGARADDGTRAATTLRGRVTTAGDVTAVVTLIDANGAQHGRAPTDDDGAFGLALPETGVWNVVVSAPGHRPRADRLVVDRHDAVVVHDVALAATDGGDDAVSGPGTRPFAAVSQA